MLLENKVFQEFKKCFFIKTLGYILNEYLLKFRWFLTLKLQFWLILTEPHYTMCQNGNFGLVFARGEILLTYMIFAYHWTS